MISADYKDINLHVGDTVRVHSTVIEGNKTRVQVFQGIILSISGRGENRMVTVRHISVSGVGVERKWPINSRSLVKFEIKKKHNKVRRSKLYYLRERSGRRATVV